MRLSDRIVVQILESHPTQVVIIDEHNGMELSLDPDEVMRMFGQALPYFIPHLVDARGNPYKYEGTHDSSSAQSGTTGG